MSEETLYFVCRLRFQGEAKYVVWCTGESDDFVRDELEQLMTANDVEELAALSASRQIHLQSDDPADYDFDRIRNWCRNPILGEEDCKSFLGAWNFLDDLSGLHRGADTPYTRASWNEASCYDKLFWGNNLPSVTPAGEHFVPAWNEEELAGIRTVMLAGLKLLEKALRSGPGRRSDGPA